MTAVVPSGTCGPQTDLVCSWVYDQTGGNRGLAAAADWLVGRPLAIAGVLVGGWVLQLLVRRLVPRGVERLVPERGVADLPAADAVPNPLDEDLSRRTTRAHAISAVVVSTLSTLIWVTVLITGCAVLGLDLGPLIASAGLAGIALAFGAQSLIKDVLRGLFIVIEDHFGVGDEVDLGEATGIVEKMTLRETVLRDLDGTVWHVPNGEIDRVGNMSQNWSVAMVDVKVARGTDLVAVRNLLEAVTVELTAEDPFVEQVIDAPEVLGVQTIDVDGVTLRVLVKTLAGHQHGLQRALLEGIETSLTAHDVLRPSTALSVRIQPGSLR